MTQDTTEREVLRKFRAGLARQLDGGAITVRGQWRRTITRADGTVEEAVLDNIVTKDGLNAIAELLLGDATGTNSGFRYLAIGTVTAEGSLGSVQAGLGEVSRKIGATIASSNEVAVLVATWAGNADGLSGVALGTGAMVNHADSGLGVYGNHVNSVAATLQDSDFLKLQMEVQIGSHNL